MMGTMGIVGRFRLGTNRYRGRWGRCARVCCPVAEVPDAFVWNVGELSHALRPEKPLLLGNQ